MKNGWETKKLGKVCNVFADGDWIEKKDQSSEEIRLVQTGNVGNGVFKDRREKARYISEKTFKRLRCTEIMPGDCLISRLPDPIGRSCIIPDTGQKMITAVDCTIIRFQKETILSLWFVYYSLSQEYQNQINKQVSGATRQRISRNNLGLIEIPLPPLPEQKRIVGILDEAFSAISTAKANAEKNLQNARELFASYLQNVFANPGEGWVEKNLGECFKLKSGNNLTSKMMSENGKFLVYGGNGIAGKYDNFNLSGNNIIVGRVGALCGNVRYIKDKIWLTDNAFKITDWKYDFDYAFLAYLLNFKNLRGYARQAAQPVISNSSLECVLLQFPKSKEEQKRIVVKLDALSTETKKLKAVYQQKLSDLEELKKSILQKAFNGELN